MRPFRRASWLRHGSRSVEVKLLTAMALVAGARGVLALIWPLAPDAPTQRNITAAAVAVFVGTLVWIVAAPWVEHAALLTGLTLATLIVASARTSTGALAVSLGFVWITLFAAFFFSSRVSRRYLVASTVALGTAMAINPFPGAVAAEVPLMLTLVVVSVATSRLVKALQDAASTDALTGLLNRHGLRIAAPAVLAQAQRTGRPLTVLLLDLDGFKQVNDEGGHAAGDQLLVDLARGWRPLLRRSDVVARLGGDEFLLLLPETDPSEAVELAQRLRQGSPIGWSYGLATAGGDQDLDELVIAADADLYRAKLRRPQIPTQRVAGEAADLSATESGGRSARA